MPDSREVVLTEPPPGSALRRPWSKLRLGIAAALVLAAVTVIAFFGANGWSLNRALNTCVGQDGDELVELQPVAAETLNSVEHQFSDYYGCADTGEPGDAAVIAEVLAWQKRNVANEYLAADGWVKQQDSAVAFNDASGEYSAQIIMGKEPNGPLHAYIYFKHAD